MPRRSRIDRYLDAFAGVERLLRDAVGADRGTPFHKVVTKAAASIPAVAEFDAEIREYSDLRNALVHERRDDKPLASPYLSTVLRLEALRDKLVRPPKLTEVVPAIKVRTVRAEETLGEVARIMFSGSFSQVPVYDGKQLLGVLTAETITRWLGAREGRESADLEAFSAASALPFTESTTSWRVVSAESDVYLAIGLFREYSLAGKSLDAILVTATGDSREDPVAIVTMFDLPRLVTAAWPYAKRSDLQFV